MIWNQLSIPIKFAIDLKSIINSDEIFNLFAFNYQFRWYLWWIYNQLSIPIEFVIDFKLIINSDGICNWFEMPKNTVKNAFLCYVHWFSLYKTLLQKSYECVTASILSLIHPLTSYTRGDGCVIIYSKDNALSCTFSKFFGD